MGFKALATTSGGFAGIHPQTRPAPSASHLV
jgi:hypothetical protein